MITEEIRKELKDNGQIMINLGVDCVVMVMVMDKEEEGRRKERKEEKKGTVESLAFPEKRP